MNIYVSTSLYDSIVYTIVPFISTKSTYRLDNSEFPMDHPKTITTVQKMLYEYPLEPMIVKEPSLRSTVSVDSIESPVSYSGSSRCVVM
jgi:hypothetical protein